MNTTFEEVYCMANIDDSVLNVLPNNERNRLLYQHIKYAIGKFEDICYKDIKTYNEFNEFIYYYTMYDNEKQLKIEEEIPEGYDIYIGIRKDENEIYTQYVEFEYDNWENIITLIEEIPNGYEILVSFYNAGSFNCELSTKEKTILALGVEYSWRNSKENKTALLNQRVYLGSTNMYSQANHISTLQTLSKETYCKLEKEIKDYSYLCNPKKLKGLVGRPRNNGWW